MSHRTPDSDSERSRPTLRELGEPEALRRLSAVRRAGSGVVVDAGDDAAVLALGAGAQLVATADAFVEGRHWLPVWSSGEALGARLAAASLSDLAAMAATPRWALLSSGVRADGPFDAVLGIQRGLAAALARHGASIVGGNLAAVDGAEWHDLTLLGEVARGRAWTRAGARPGDLVAVSGSPGRAAAGLALAHRLGDAAREERWTALRDAWLAPRARVALAAALAPLGAVTAAIDVSDGCAGDLARLAEASGVGADLDEAAWPADPELAAAAAELGVPLDELRLGPSDDYELLLAVDPAGRDACAAAARALGQPLAFVGSFSDAPGVLRRRSKRGLEPIEARGFDHFSDTGS